MGPQTQFKLQKFVVFFIQLCRRD